MYRHEFTMTKFLRADTMLLLLLVVVTLQSCEAFVTSFAGSRETAKLQLSAAKGFGGGDDYKSPSLSKKKKKASLADQLEDKVPPKKEPSLKMPFVKSQQDEMLEDLQQKSANTWIGRAVAESPPSDDPFWQLMPSLISARFSSVPDSKLRRIAGVVRHALDPLFPLEDDIIKDPYRPHGDIHAYMPGLGPTKPFYNPAELTLCQKLTENYEVIKAEYHALLQDMNRKGGKNRFQTVTSMNYEAGWQTLVLFYNGHRIKDFPYNLAPVTTSILESYPLAGRIAGFNRQQPQSGIPLHSDGNNMWLTCQMGIEIPEGDAAYIRVGAVTNRWKAGECLVYDTTYEHETFNEHPTQERVVLHVDFFNTLAMTPVEIEVMQYIYSLREQFLKAEGNAKVGAQLL
jgi:hypothetical protein